MPNSSDIEAIAPSAASKAETSSSLAKSRAKMPYSPTSPQRKSATSTHSAAETPTPPALEPATVERVVDGDTLIVETDSGERERVRLIGVNAPESVAPEEERNTEEGRRASTWMHIHVLPRTHVWLQADVEDEDDYGRKLRYVWTARPQNPESTREFRALTLNAQLVAAGQAEAHSYPPNTTYDLLLQAIEDGI